MAQSYGFIGARKAMDGTTLEALELITADPDGWPHTAWLSPGEILPMSPTRFAIALWPASTTTSNLERTGKALAELVADGNLFKARLQMAPLGSIPVEHMTLAGFVCDVQEVKSDAVGYASVVSGLRYELGDPQAVGERWIRQLEALAGAVDDSGRDIEAAEHPTGHDERKEGR